MKYFAYGSNMDASRMKERKINYSSRQFAILKDFKLVFDKKARDGDYSYANIVQQPGEKVEGILYELAETEISKLDYFEGYPFHYKRIEINVLRNDKHIRAVSYIAQPDKTAEGLLPKKEYLNHLLAGKDLLSKEYISFLMSIRTIEEKYI
jgi:gamma-glutamylcyclotransferase (GGCT)/AIG2-like uncharacterized protein YtfP